MSRIKVLNVSFDALDTQSVAAIILDKISSRQSDGKPFCVFTPNPLIVMQAKKNPDFAKLLDSADLSLADGWGIVRAAERLGTPLPCRCGGIDVAELCFSELAKTHGSLYILGGKAGIAEKAAAALAEKYPGLIIAGFRDGYFKDDEKDGVCAEISAASPDFLAVCLGSPKQERFICENKVSLRCGCAMGLGGSSDVWSGNKRRAPYLFLKLKIEWLWRMLCEPKRFLQIPALLHFVFLTFFAKKE